MKSIGPENFRIFIYICTRIYTLGVTVKNLRFVTNRLHGLGFVAGKKFDFEHKQKCAHV